MRRARAFRPSDTIDVVLAGTMTNGANSGAIARTRLSGVESGTGSFSTGLPAKSCEFGQQASPGTRAGQSQYRLMKVATAAGSSVPAKENRMP